MNEFRAYNVDMMGQPVIVYDIITYSVMVYRTSELRIGMVTEILDNGLRVLIINDYNEYNYETKTHKKVRSIEKRTIKDMSRVFKIETFSNQYNDLRKIFDTYEEQERLKRRERAAKKIAKKELLRKLQLVLTLTNYEAAM